MLKCHLIVQQLASIYSMIRLCLSVCLSVCLSIYLSKITFILIRLRFFTLFSISIRVQLSMYHVKNVFMFIRFSKDASIYDRWGVK